MRRCLSSGEETKMTTTTTTTEDALLQRSTTAPGAAANGAGTTATTTTTTTHKFSSIILNHDEASNSCSSLKKPKTCRQKCLLLSSVAGAVSILSAVICAFVMKPIVEKQILQNLPLKDGSQVYHGWKDPPVNPVLYFYVFNLTNKDEFLSGRQKPKLQELGPYSYVQDMRKVNVTFSPDGSRVSYMQSRAYFFSPELSSQSLSEDDVVVVPNVPFFGALKHPDLQTGFGFVDPKQIFLSMLASYENEAFIDTTPFVRTTVGQFLWGYPSVLLSIERQQKGNCKDNFMSETDDEEDDPFWDFASTDDTSDSEPTNPQINCDIVPGNLAQFGLYRGRNNSILDLRTIKTGTQNLDDKGMMTEWHGKPRVSYWRGGDTSRCNLVEGRDPGTWSTNLNTDSVLHAFVGPLCRKLRLKYTRDVRVGDFDTLQFSPLPNSFDSPSKEPANDCYCLDPSSCLPSGLLDISGCQPEGASWDSPQGNPIYMSWPHFLHGDPLLLDGVEGLSPDISKHTFIFNIEPKYGISLTALAKLQMNLLIEKNDGSGFFEDISQDKIYYPFAWIEEGIPGPSEKMAEQVKLLLGLPDLMQRVMPLCNLVLGLMLLSPVLVGWLTGRCSGGGGATGWICKRRNVADSNYTAASSASKKMEVKEDLT